MVNRSDLNKNNIECCKHCGSILGIDCGEAEPDYNEHYCSKGCFKSALENILFADVDDQSRHKFILEL